MRLFVLIPVDVEGIVEAEQLPESKRGSVARPESLLLHGEHGPESHLVHAAPEVSVFHVGRNAGSELRFVEQRGTDPAGNPLPHFQQQGASRVRIRQQAVIHAHVNENAGALQLADKFVVFRNANGVAPLIGDQFPQGFVRGNAVQGRRFARAVIADDEGVVYYGIGGKNRIGNIHLGGIGAHDHALLHLGPDKSRVSITAQNMPYVFQNVLPPVGLALLGLQFLGSHGNRRLSMRLVPGIETGGIVRRALHGHGFHRPVGISDTLFHLEGGLPPALVFIGCFGNDGNYFTLYAHVEKTVFLVKIQHGVDGILFPIGHIVGAVFFRRQGKHSQQSSFAEIIASLDIRVHVYGQDQSRRNQGQEEKSE